MPDYRARELRSCFVGRLGAHEDETRRHRSYSFLDPDGTMLGQTYRSHGHRTMHVSLLGRMTRELGVRLEDLRGAVDCTTSRLDFYDLLRSSSAP